MARERMEFDVVIVGAGPAGLSTAIRLAQLGSEQSNALNICVIDKAESIGGQIISGAVLDPTALFELFPDALAKGAPLEVPVTEDQFLFLTKNKSFQLPTPALMKNDGNYIISLEVLCQWLALQAEQLGVNIFPGFSAVEVIYENDRVVGIMTGDKGVNKEGKPTEHYQPGMELWAKHTFFAEGCRGSLSQTLFKKFDLRQGVDPQTYGIGIKEIWEVPKELHQPGLVQHSMGWPLDNATYGGSFVYHLQNNLVALGLIIGLDYENPYLNPYEELQRFKSHSFIRPLLEKSKRIAYGARSLNEGGFQSIPKLSFPGGSFVGCAAGFVNVPRIKGIHNAMKTGMTAAESFFFNEDYSARLKKTWVWQELYRVRNVRPAMRWGLLLGLAYAGLDIYLLRGRAPWTLRNHADHLALKEAKDCKKIEYPKHDNHISFDLMNSVFLTNIEYDENQPCHLKLKNKETPIKINLEKYAAPEQRYCPAGVYEIVRNELNIPHLQINAANCIHCKACDIKDPTQNIVWTPPEGGSGPQYNLM